LSVNCIFQNLHDIMLKIKPILIKNNKIHRRFFSWKKSQNNQNYSMHVRVVVNQSENYWLLSCKWNQATPKVTNEREQRTHTQTDADNKSKKKTNKPYHEIRKKRVNDNTNAIGQMQSRRHSSNNALSFNWNMNVKNACKSHWPQTQ
jgi:hypothetical protein